MHLTPNLEVSRVKCDIYGPEVLLEMSIAPIVCEYHMPSFHVAGHILRMHLKKRTAQTCKLLQRRPTVLQLAVSNEVTAQAVIL